MLVLLLGMAPLTGAQAARCPGLKSGTHVMLNPVDADPDRRVNLVSIDARALVLSDRSGSVALTATADTCRYALPDGSPLVVSPQRMLMQRLAGGGAVGWALGMPLEKASLKSLKGAWNFLRQCTDAGLSTTNHGVIQLKSDGSGTATFCDAQVLNCSGPGNIGLFTPHPEGGFAMTGGDGSIERLFVVTADDGSRMGLMVGVSKRAFTVMSPLAPRSLPSAGERFVAWELSQAADGALAPLTDSHYKVQSVDAAT